MNGNILFISNQSDMTNTLIRHVEKQLFHVEVSDNRYDAFFKIKQKNFDVVVMVLQGFERECIEIIRGINKALQFTRIIIINNSKQLNLSIKCMKAGAFEDFMPPVDTNRLLEKIALAKDLRRIDMKKVNKRLGRLDRLMMAVSFAEAGEVETALKFLYDKKIGGSHGEN